jgi:uncharacterized membrane protein
MLIIKMRMRYQRAREKRFVVAVLTLTGALFLTIVSSSLMLGTLQPVQALLRTEVMSCPESVNSCQTMICTNNEPCHVFQSNSDSYVTNMAPKQDDIEVIEGIMNSIPPPDEDGGDEGGDD